MLAHVVNHMTDTDLHLRLVQLEDGRVVWQDLETGKAHSGLFEDARAAARGLQLAHNEPGTHVFIKPETGDPQVEVNARAA